MYEKTQYDSMINYIGPHTIPMTYDQSSNYSFNIPYETIANLFSNEKNSHSVIECNEKHESSV